MQTRKFWKWSRLGPVLAALLLSGCASGQPRIEMPSPGARPPSVSADKGVRTTSGGMEESPAPAGALAAAADPIAELIPERLETLEDPRARALEVARQLLGTPYSRGGDSPAGFDCSGLVYYVFREAGIALPRTSREQYRSIRPIAMERLEPGDLLFFRIARQQISHVGIFVEADRFIHAPSYGKTVSFARLSDPYWRQRLAGAGRVSGPQP